MIDVFLNEFNDWHLHELHDVEEKFAKMKEGKDALVRPLMKGFSIDDPEVN